MELARVFECVDHATYITEVAFAFFFWMTEALVCVVKWVTVIDAHLVSPFTLMIQWS